jgi:DNA-binding MarR family transcriptional regulator
MTIDELANMTIKNMHEIMSSKSSHHDIDFFAKGELFTLFAIEHQKVCKAKELSIKLKCSQARMTKIFSSLEEKGFILRKIDDNDRRSEFVTITESGKKYMEECTQKRFSKIKNIINLIGEEDTLHFNMILEKLLLISKQEKEVNND